MQLVDPSNQSNENKPFNPNVDNTQRKAVAGIFGKIIWYFLWLYIIPVIIHVKKRNELMKDQVRINEQSSGIDVQLKKRRDTLVKLVNATKSYVKYEKSVMTDITKLRNLTFSGNSKTQEASMMNSIAGRIMAVAENYPNLKADKAVNNMMEQAAYLEREIAAARRLYNSSVAAYNTQLFTWPSAIVAASMGLSTIAMFSASEADKKDVDVNF